MELVTTDLKKRGADNYDVDSATCTIYAHNNVTDSITQLSSVNNIITLDEGYFVGYDIPHFHSRKRAGELLPQTPWHQYERDVTCEGWYAAQVIESGQSVSLYCTGPYTVAAPTGAWTLSEEDLMAEFPAYTDKYVQQAAAKIYSSGFDALTFLAEFTDVIRLFKTVGKQLLTLRLPKNWRDYSNEWLSWRYGWRTLMYDIQNINELLSEFDSKRTRWKETQGVTQRHEVSEVTSKEFDYWYCQKTTTDKVTKSLRGTVIADIEIPKLQFNPFVTAWEKIPLSFVLDWFVTVGKAIDAASFLCFSSAYSASRGIRVDMERLRTLTDVSAKPGYVSGGCELALTTKAYREVRIPCSVPVTPHLTLNLDSKRVLDLVALVIQRLK